MDSSQQITAGSSPQGLRIPRVVDKTGLSRAHIYKLIKEHQFPAPYKLSERVSVWDEQEVSAWLAAKFSRRG
jgi:prophage regulatory protein